MAELTNFPAGRIGIREAARRIGVSDTAVRKAIAAGQVQVAGKHPGNGRPELDWPACRDAWLANKAHHKRTHVGGTGKSARREEYRAENPAVVLPVANKTQVGDAPQAVGPVDRSYNDSRAAREHYQAELARLEFEAKEGKLVDAEEVKSAWLKLIVAAKTRILGIPAACKSRRSDLPLEVVAVIDDVCRQALEDLANGAG